VDVNDQAYEGCRAEGTYIDVGANIGAYTVKFAKKFERVFAFEPDFKNLRALLDATKEFDNVTVCPSAVSAGTGWTRLWIGPHGGSHTISEKVGETEQYGYTGTRLVPCISIDDFVQGAKIDDLVGMKIDVEGAEQLVLEGAFYALKKFDLRVSLETHDTIDCAAISALLRECGYVVRDVTGPVVNLVLVNSQYLISKE
jgi:FkbM family methyltransferase